MRRKYTSGQLKEIREKAISLRLQGLRPKEIATRLGTGHTPGTISRWLKRSDRIPSTRESAISLHEQGLTVEEIAERIRVDKSQVWRILRDYRGKLRNCNSPEQNVNLFLADPQGNMNKRFVRSGPFGWALLKKLARAANDDPLKHREAVRQSVELFTMLRHNRRNPNARREATCLLVFAVGIDALIDSVTADPELGLAKMEEIRSLAHECDACEADYPRILGIVYGHLGYFNAALSAIAKARAKYKSLGTAGHNLLGNGLGACCVARAAIRNLSVGANTAAADAREGLRITSPKDSPFLYSILVLNLARYLKDSDDPVEVHEARLMLDQCLDFFDYSESTKPRLYTRWLDALLALREGHPRDAEIILRHALADARKLKLESEVAAIVADIGAINPRAEDMKDEIEDMLVWDLTAETPTQALPNWIRDGIREALESLYRSAKKSAMHAERVGRTIEKSTLKALRDVAETASNGKVMPSFVL